MIHPTKPLPEGAARRRVALARGPRTSSTQATATEPPPAPRRVREQAREAVTVMLFSLATSVALASALVLLSRLGNQG